jgi:hypothetical protein
MNNRRLLIALMSLTCCIPIILNGQGPSLSVTAIEHADKIVNRYISAVGDKSGKASEGLKAKEKKYLEKLERLERHLHIISSPTLLPNTSN